MERRFFLQAAAMGAAVFGTARELFAAEKYFPSKADQALFETINRVKDAAKKTPLEKSHAPVITAPAAVKAGEPFMVTVAVGENLHAMGPAHWIESIELNIGNEPAARVDLQSKGYAAPKVSFTLLLQKDVTPGGKVTLVARQHCNLHGYWESSLDVTVG